MKKSMIYRSLGLVLAVNLAMQSGFVSMAAENTGSSIEIADEVAVSSEDNSLSDEISIEEEEQKIEDAEDITVEDTVDVEEPGESVDISANDSSDEAVDMEEDLGDEAELLGGSLTANMSWDYNGGVLTIKGSGIMPDYGYHDTPWEANRTSIKKVVFSGSVTAIGNYAFYECTNLKEVVFCNTITVIGRSAFAYTSLTSVNFPNSLREIQQSAFYCCNISKVTIPSKIATIEGHAFYGNKQLSEVAIESKSIVSAGYAAFCGCAIRKITFPKDMVSIPDSLFDGATFSDCSIVIPASVKTIGTRAFYADDNSKGSFNVTFESGSNLTSIGRTAFYNTHLDKITLPSSLKEIGSDAFGYCRLTEITIPENVSIIGDFAFKYNKSLSKVVIKPKTLSKTGMQIFYGCSLSKVELPEGMKLIPEYMFYHANFSGCSITIPKTVTTIGSHAFSASDTDRDAKGISELKFEEGSALNEIGAAAFEYTHIEKLRLPEGLKIIGACAFQGTRISEITIPSKVSKMDYYVFHDCKLLEKVTINSTYLTDVGTGIFEDCMVSEVNLPKGMTMIPNDMFYSASFVNCTITIPASVTSIGNNAFWAHGNGERGLSEVKFEKGSKLTKIGSHAFQNAPLDYVALPDSLLEIGSYAFANTRISEIVIPSKVTTIENCAFEDCKYLSRVTLPASVKDIGYYAFKTGGAGQIRFFVKAGTYAYEWVKKNAETFNFVISAAYEIAYVLGGGTNNPKNPTMYEKGDYITLYAPTRTGYSFKGWFLDAAYKKSADNVDTSKGNKLTFYAKWEAGTYTVKYNGNGNGAYIAGDTQFQIKYGAKYPKPLATASRNGYKFAGWYTLPQGGSVVKGGSTVFKPENPGSAVLYAHWTPVKYKITYQLEGGTLKKKTPASYTMDQDAVLPTPTKTGYTFTGWTVVSSTGKTNVAAGGTIAGGKGNYGDVVLKATWKMNGYKLIIHENKKGAQDKTCTSGIIYYEDIVCMFDMAALLKNKCGTSETEKISSFTTKANGKGKKYTIAKSYSKLSTGDSQGTVTIELYAQWGKNANYQITYDLGGGILKSPVYSYTGAKAVKIAAPKKKGYKFVGWEVSGPGASSVKLDGTTATIQKGGKGKIHFKAKYKQA